MTSEQEEDLVLSLLHETTWTLGIDIQWKLNEHVPWWKIWRYWTKNQVLNTLMRLVMTNRADPHSYCDYSMPGYHMLCVSFFTKRKQ